MAVIKKKVRFLAVIWGERYVDEFAAISLPSYLAPGNLPVLAATTDLEVLILTSQESLPAFNRSPAFSRLREICPIRFIMIDDLIADGAYGVTLTLAYARGIRSMGGAQTKTYFVFMNSDFVLADGSLRHLVKLMQTGHSCIMAASLRGQAEALLPQLSGAISDNTHQLVMSPREMVALTLANLHPTVIAKTMTQSRLNCLTQNQLYWQIDDQTLLGRSYLIFMLAIRPEVPIGAVNSYCDYGFVPEMVPSGKFHVISDSDDFFMLELQPAAQEEESLTYGAITPARLARHLSTWTTAEHRRFAQCDTVFHAGELPAVLDDFRAQANATVDTLAKKMGKPRNHAEHIFWVRGLRWWWSRRRIGQARPVTYSKALAEAWQARGMASSRGAPLPRAFPEELLRKPARFRPTRLMAAFPWLIDILGTHLGIFPYLSLWHPRWPDAKLLMSWIGESRSSAVSVRLVDLGDRSLARALANEPGVEICVVTHGEAAIPDHATGGDILVCFPASKMRNHAEFRHLDRLLEQAGMGSRFGLFLYQPRQSDVLSISDALVTMLSRYALSYDIELSMIGGRARNYLLRVEYWCRQHLWPSFPLAVPFTLIAVSLWPATIIMIFLGNHLWWSKFRRKQTISCSSMILTFRRHSRSATGTTPQNI